MTSVCPVTNEAASDARNTAPPTISSGDPMRPSGVRLTTRSLISALSTSADEKRVFINPGAIAFTRIPTGPSS